MFGIKVVGNVKTHISYSLTYFFVNEIMWENIVKRSRSQITVWFVVISCWIPKATNTQSQYLIRFSATLVALMQFNVIFFIYLFIFHISYRYTHHRFGNVHAVVKSICRRRQLSSYLRVHR